MYSLIVSQESEDNWLATLSLDQLHQHFELLNLCMTMKLQLSERWKELQSEKSSESMERNRIGLTD